MSDIQQLLAAYDAAFLAQFGEKAPIVAGKDAKLAKELIARHGLEKCIQWVQRFCKSQDAFIKQSGYTFGVFHAQLGKVMLTKLVPARVEPTPEQIAHVAKIKAAEAAYVEPEPPKPSSPKYLTDDQRAELLRQMRETMAKIFTKEM